MKIAIAIAAPALAAAALVAAAVQAAPSAGGSGDPARGKTLFQQRCVVCHSVGGQGGKVGPNLAGVVGRKAGTTGFNYSPAMKKSGLVWNAATLDSYLTSPMKKVPGARMTVSVPKADERRDIIAYLGTAR